MPTRVGRACATQAASASGVLTIRSTRAVSDRHTSIHAFETSAPIRTSPPLLCIAPPAKLRKTLVGTPDCMRASRAQTTVRVSDRDAGGSEMATVSSDQSTTGEPAGVPILTMAHHNAIHAAAPTPFNQSKLILTITNT